MNDVELFLSGVEAGLDPQPLTEAIAQDGSAITSPSSSWNHQRCTTCGQSFRRGDAVHILTGPPRRIVHTAAGLNCGSAAAGGEATSPAAPEAEVTITVETAGGDPPGGSDPGADSGGDAARFAAGLLRRWPVGNQIPVHVLAADDWRIARPSASRPSTCLYCGHTFRAGEHVVICPCRPNSELCAAAVHRDPAAGLNCWEAWRPDSSLKVCPVTLTRLGRHPHA